MAEQQTRSQWLAGVEFQSAVLVRSLEMIRRRGDLYVEVDRAVYLLLRMLDETGPLDIGSLARELGLDPSTVGRQVSAAERAGHVERLGDTHDRRRRLVALTEAGRTAMRMVQKRRVDGTKMMLADWSSDDLRALKQTFARYNEAIMRTYPS